VIINRYNYEEFFLLYADNELDANARTAVETFVSQNADLAKELEMLQQATLADDTIQFTGKELLYKEEKSISLSNYEEYFLLFADDELNEQQTAEVESFILMHPKLQNEFTLLKHVRLQPEAIAFAGKEVLYRKERKVRRIVPLALARVGAAAAVAGIAYISFIFIYNNSHNKNITTASEKTVPAILEKINPDRVQRSVTEQPVAALHPKTANKNKATNVAANTRKLRKEDTRKVKKTEKPEEQLAVDVKEHENKIKNTEQQKANEVTANREQEIAEVHPNRKNFNDNKKSEIINPDEKNSLMTNEPITEGKPLVTHAVYLETDNVEEEKSLYIGSAELNKNKLKGLLKKATVFFDKKIRRSNDNDN